MFPLGQEKLLTYIISPSNKSYLITKDPHLFMRGSPFSLLISSSRYLILFSCCWQTEAYLSIAIFDYDLSFTSAAQWLWFSTDYLFSITWHLYQVSLISLSFSLRSLISSCIYSLSYASSLACYSLSYSLTLYLTFCSLIFFFKSSIAISLSITDYWAICS
jgi:hypothetical protein